NLLNYKIKCVKLEMELPDRIGYETLEAIKSNEGMENLPIIIFTGKNLSHTEEMKIKNYADSIVIKTAHSFQRILDEVGLFLHLVEENNGEQKSKQNKLGALGRSEEHTSELQSRENLVCRLLLEKKKKRHS